MAGCYGSVVLGVVGVSVAAVAAASAAGALGRGAAASGLFFVDSVLLLHGGEVPHKGEDAAELYLRREWVFWCVCAGVWHHSRQAVRMEVTRAAAAVTVPMMPRVRARVEVQ